MDQTEKLIRLEKIKIFLMGVIITLAFLFLIGSGPSVQDIGRYQITACASEKGFGVYRVDTTTGEVKKVFGKL